MDALCDVAATRLRSDVTVSVMCEMVRPMIAHKHLTAADIRLLTGVCRDFRSQGRHWFADLGGVDAVLYSCRDAPALMEWAQRFDVDTRVHLEDYSCSDEDVQALQFAPGVRLVTVDNLRYGRLAEPHSRYFFGDEGQGAYLRPRTHSYREYAKDAEMPASLSALRELTRLEAPPDLGRLTALRSLRSLNIHDSVSDLRHLTHVTRLRCKTDSRSWYPPNLVELEDATWDSGRLERWATRQRLTRLTRLTLGGVPFHDSARECMPNLRMLRSFVSDELNAHGRVPDAISSLPSLEHLWIDRHLNGPTFNAAATKFPGLQDLTQLKGLTLILKPWQLAAYQQETPVVQSLDFLTGLSGLTSLRFEFGEAVVPSRGMDWRHLESLTGLRSLEISRAPCTYRNALPHFSMLPALTYLSVETSEGKGLRELADLRHLRHLCIKSYCRDTCDRVRCMFDNKSRRGRKPQFGSTLERLDLLFPSDTRADWAPLIRGIAGLTQLRTLGLLDIADDKVLRQGPSPDDLEGLPYVSTVILFHEHYARPHFLSAFKRLVRAGKLVKRVPMGPYCV